MGLTLSRQENAPVKFGVSAAVRMVSDGFPGLSRELGHAACLCILDSVNKSADQIRRCG